MAAPVWREDTPAVCSCGRMFVADGFACQCSACEDADADFVCDCGLWDWACSIHEYGGRGLRWTVDVLEVTR